MLYARKLLRELRRQKGQVAAVVSVTAIGVLLFVSSAGAYTDLRDSYTDTRARLGLASLHIDVSRASPEDLESIRHAPGVRTVDARTVCALPIVVRRDGRISRVQLRVISIPDGRQPALDRVLKIEGRLPQNNDEVLLEKHFAQHHHLSTGDQITVDAGGLIQSLTVSGVAVSAEYLWVARNEEDVFPSPDAFGVGWMGRSALRTIARRLVATASESAAARLPGIEVAASDAIGNQVLVDTITNASESTELRAIDQILGSRIVRVTRADRLVGVRLLQMDVDGFKGMAGFFPLFFLCVGAFIVASIMARIVNAQRAIVGTFMALGVSRARVLVHYLLYALTVGGVGALLGAGLGLASARSLTHAYAGELGIPFVVTRIHWDLALCGIAVASLVALLAGLVPAFHASRLAPAEAMRAPSPHSGVLSRAARSWSGPLAVRMAIRDLLGRPLRTIGTAVGVAAALVLVLTTGATVDSMRSMFSVLFHDAQRYDLRVDLAGPEHVSDAESHIRQIRGVQVVESIFAIPVTFAFHGRQSAALLQGLPPDERLIRSMDLNGQWVIPDHGGIVMTRAVARSLGVHVGDEITVLAQTGAEASFRVSGFADGTVGNTASALRSDVQTAFGLPDQVTSVLVAIAPGHLEQVRSAVSALPDVARVEDLASTRLQIHQLMGLGWIMLMVMLVCSVVLASAILFNMATLGILERRRELATLRALGRSFREIGFGITLEHSLVCLLGLAFGYPLALFAIKRVLALYSSDLFRFPFVLSPTTIGAAFVGIVSVLLLAQWPALRQVSRDSLADAVRVREA